MSPQPNPSEATGWERISCWELGQLTAGETPEGMRWKWRVDLEGGDEKHRLVKPDGSVWDFKLQGGAWMKRYESNNESL